MDKIYLSPEHPGSFGGVARLKQHTILSTSKIQNYLNTQSCYTRNKQRRDKFRRRKVEVHEPFYLWQADIVFLRNLKKYNNNHEYLLTVIDCFSRYAYAIPLKKKTSSEVIRGLTEVFRLSKHYPKYLHCDQGTEFFSVSCKPFLKKHNVILYHTYSDFKACVVERFHKTLLNRLSKYITHSQCYRYIEVLPKVIKSYNNTIHSSLGVAPSNVNKNNEMEVWLMDHKKSIKSKPTKQLFTVGDPVRLLKRKETFQKGYMPTYTSEIFQISEVLSTHPVCYRVKDMSNTQLNGIFYNQELQKAT